MKSVRMNKNIKKTQKIPENAASQVSLSAARRSMKK